MKLFKLFLAFSLFSSQAFAQSQQFLANPISEQSARSRISEFFYEKTGSEVLHPVKLLGTVNKPGIYHVPQNTKLTTLLSVAGGTAIQADLANVSVSNPSGATQKIDFRATLESGKDVNLKPDDIIFVPEKKHMISPDTSNTIMITTAVISVLLTGIVVFRDK